MPAWLVAAHLGGSPVLWHTASAWALTGRPSISIGPIGPICGAIGLPDCNPLAGIGSDVAGGLANDVLGALVQWVVGAATWLLGQIGAVLTDTTVVNVGAPWFKAHYHVMQGIGVVFLLPMMLASIISAIARQDVGPLLRMVLVQLPLSAILTFIAVKVVGLSLTATDALSTTVSSGSGQDVKAVLTALVSAFAASGTTNTLPGLILLVGALLVVMASFLLWIELLFRAAAIYAAVLFLPLVLASLVWPSVSHWCRRLVETLASLILSKFVIVAVLSLAAGAVASGTSGSGGFASLLGGGALLLLASFTPFTLLRLIPLAEASAITHLEGARHRVSQGMGTAPGGMGQNAARMALRHLATRPAAIGGTAGTGDPDPTVGAKPGLRTDPPSEEDLAGAGSGGSEATGGGAAAGGASAGLGQLAGGSAGASGDQPDEAAAFFAAAGIGPYRGTTADPPSLAEGLAGNGSRPSVLADGYLGPDEEETHDPPNAGYGGWPWPEEEPWPPENIPIDPTKKGGLYRS